MVALEVGGTSVNESPISLNLLVPCGTSGLLAFGRGGFFALVVDLSTSHAYNVGMHNTTGNNNMTNTDSPYYGKTAAQKMALVNARRAGDAVPRCEANWTNIDDDCDIRASHICGISERSQMFAKFFKDNLAPSN